MAKVFGGLAFALFVHLWWRSAGLGGGLTIGFCGAFTTMSTFSYESIRLLGDGEYWYAGLYMGGTIVGCLAAVITGTAVASKLL